MTEPIIVDASDYGVSHREVDSDARKVLRRLRDQGHVGYIVGGGVRDLLLGKRPKDFDIATDATTSKVRELFRNSRTIGKRFKLNQVYFRDGKIFEVSSFRAALSCEGDEPETLQDDNEFGDAFSDAHRRDLTINGLFYDVLDGKIIDYVGGLEDLKNCLVRIIGEPKVRIVEDPVRMIRAIRHAARAGLFIEPVTREAIESHSHYIKECPRVRVYEEFCREVIGGASCTSFRMMLEYGLLGHVVPILEKGLSGDRARAWNRLDDVLVRLDAEVREGREVPISVALLAIFIGALGSRVVPLVDLPGKIPNSIKHALDTVSQFLCAGRVVELDADDDEFFELVRSIFLPIGVYKRDLYHMADLLRFRIHLLSSDLADENARYFLKQKHFNDCLLLFRLTSGEHETACVTERLLKLTK